MTATTLVKASVAYGSDPYDSSPDWTVLDGVTGVSLPQTTTKRGRTYLTERTEAGEATLTFADRSGALDPTNTSSPLYPLDPNCPAKIELYNPIADNYVSIYRGFVQDTEPTLYSNSQGINRGQIPLADLFSLLAIDQIPPGLVYAAQTPGDYTAIKTAQSIGDTLYAAQNVGDRMRAILADAGVPSGLTDIFSGNVVVQATVVQPGYAVLSALQDAADAEFPYVANIYVDKTGIFTFHGRLARFNSGPDNPYGITTWQLGDAAAVAADTSKVLINAQNMQIGRPVDKIVNNALFLPQGIADRLIPGQLVADGTSISKYGNRAIGGTGQYLLTGGGVAGGDGLDALQECLTFGEFFVDNLAYPFTTVLSVVVTQINPRRSNGEAHWDFLCNVELNDVVEFYTTHIGGGGFDGAAFFVEGISYSFTPGNAGVPVLQCKLDLSSKDVFTVNPWSS